MVEMLSFTSDMTIEAIGEKGNSYVDRVWSALYEKMHEELTTAFAEIEDAAYGLYLDQLMPPLFEELEKNGFKALGEVEEGDFIIGKCLNFRNSLEKWGTEDNRSRIFWNVIKNSQNQPIGTLLTELPHSHYKFDIPVAPQIHIIQEFEKQKIVLKIREIKEKSN
ncbi:hypothetical protein I6N90_20535 [Paenibacillus sp. GSMTC-2017]|uniref:DUF6022 family protein n=1 Tax=Paenibacillus sp. GSMTC-2017 TaxID=2794350 RepID=UPI0018D5F7A8|nr:DUF6022 family protein [Paenibacillus sp. GSMTC-2017]MBH5320197.1 hypothetical protein [Paenibacillus sp. GSMTC-2017]